MGRRRWLSVAGSLAVWVALLSAFPLVPARSRVAAAGSETPASAGYWLAGEDGSMYAFGGAADQGSLAGKSISRPVTGIAATPSGLGYWLVGSDGGIFSFGDAGFFGSTGHLRLNQPIVGMAATPTGRGYWFVASDGGVFSFGDAGFFGSTGSIKLNRPIVGMAATPTGRGYWLVASDGGVFAFGDAGFFGSTGSITLNRPIVDLAPTQTGNGYWFVASDGGVFSFGDAGFFGSTGSIKLNRPIVGIAATPSDRGYWFVASDGGIFNFGDAAFLGSAAGRPLPAGIAAVAARPAPDGPESPTGSRLVPRSPATTTTTDASTPTSPSPSPSPTTTTTGGVTTGPSPETAPFDIGLVGDTGYSAQGLDTFEDVVDQMNRFDLAFITHDGDVKNPTSTCDDKRLAQVLASFNSSKNPFIYTPGDNEWMDCPDADPVERLAHIRRTFFPADQSLGKNHLPLTTGRSGGYPENARWTKDGVVFATINAPGPNDDLPNSAESNPRRVANLAWLQAAFDLAESTHAPAVMIVWQANPFEPFEATWKYLMKALKDRTVVFGKPVVLVHGDTHIHRIDQPWPDVSNFTRVETYAGPEADYWIRATVDPADPKVFTFKTERAS